VQLQTKNVAILMFSKLFMYIVKQQNSVRFLFPSYVYHPLKATLLEFNVTEIFEMKRIDVEWVVI